MTKRSLASLVLKLMAVYVLISSIPALPYILGLIQMMADANRFWVSLATLSTAFMFPIIWIAFGLLLIKFADRIASKLVPEDEDAGMISVQSVDTIQKVIFVSIGVLVTVHTLPQIVQVVAGVVYSSRSDVAFAAGRAIRFPVGKLLCFITQATLGCFLMIRPSKVLALIKRYQKENRQPTNALDSEKAAPSASSRSE